jgi:hypothetical protein
MKKFLFTLSLSVTMLNGVAPGACHDTIARDATGKRVPSPDRVSRDAPAALPRARVRAR